MIHSGIARIFQQGGGGGGGHSMGAKQLSRGCIPPPMVGRFLKI